MTLATPDTPYQGVYTLIRYWASVPWMFPPRSSWHIRLDIYRPFPRHDGSGWHDWESLLGLYRAGGQQSHIAMSGGQGKEVDDGMDQSGGFLRPSQRMEVDLKRSGFSERQALSILVLPAPIPTRTKPRRIALSGMKHSTSSSWLPCFLCASAGPG